MIQINPQSCIPDFNLKYRLAYLVFVVLFSSYIDLHQKSTAKTHEKAIAGKISGLIGLHETVTWRARHLGFYQNLTTKIIHMHRPYDFTDIMIQGIFKYIKHQHIFRKIKNYTVMIDIFEFESPGGIIGKFFNLIFLKNYMKNLLEERNEIMKKAAEQR
ncbi:SRPBCC family protein [Chryseobacterium sp. SSA4.19]|uniref:SRPBCC family protein n=1 Tax=Chryseobacterium sp. SSA4.19 TaxID=2919915 RepID=UPI001F4EB1CD|nr:SRPBCC family protein [Chryseobacterium sp. SSA4.19]MCJ8155314.1 SRPBCC family protein [Chryseobacterium sp. SSA4.19]